MQDGLQRWCCVLACSEQLHDAGIVERVMPGCSCRIQEATTGLHVLKDVPSKLLVEHAV